MAKTLTTKEGQREYNNFVVERESSENDNNRASDRAQLYSRELTCSKTITTSSTRPETNFIKE